MKKLLCCLLSLSLILGTFVMPVCAETKSQVELTELLFLDDKGEVIGKNPNTTVKLRATVSTNFAEIIGAYVGAYSGDGSLISVDFAEGIFTEASTKIIETPVGANGKDAARISAFVFKSDLTPVTKRIDLGSQAMLLDASITIPDYRYTASTAGDYTFDAVVNNKNKTVTFYIPYTTYTNEINADQGTAVPGVKPDVDAVKYSFNTVGSASVAENVSIDADSVNALTVTSPDGKVTSEYTVEHKFVAVERRLTDTSSADISNNRLTYTGDVNILTGNVQLDNSGYIIAENNAVTVNNENINLNFTSSSPQEIAFRPSVYNALYSNDHVKISYKFRVTGFNAQNDGRFAYTTYINDEGIELIATGEDTFRISHRHISKNEKGELFQYCPELKTDTWYTYTMVLDKSNKYEKDYIIDSYIDGKYIGSAADSPYGTPPSAAFDRASGYGYELRIATYTGSTVNMDIADIEAVSVISKDNTAGKTTVHILGDSISKYYSLSTSSTSQEGWGYALSQAFDLTKVRVLNHSVGGYNTNIYLNGANRNDLKSEPIWDTVESNIKSGDYVLVALGRNEGNSTDGTKTATAFESNLEIIADKITNAGAIPVFVNAIPSVDITNEIYTLNNDINSTDMMAARTMREFATAKGYTLLDLNAESFHELSDYTSDELKTIYLSDKIHITEKGADLISDLLVKLISNNSSNLKSLLKEDYKANHAYAISATATVGDKTYIGDVNTDSNMIVFEQALVPDKDKDKVVSEWDNITSVTLNVTANGTVSGIENPLNLTNPQTITITQGTDVESYTVKFDRAHIARTYNANGNKNDNAGAASTNEFRKYIIAADNSSGNSGYGGWFAENAASPDGGINQSGAGTIRAENNVIKFIKTDTDKALNLGSYSSDISTHTTNNKVSVEFKVKVNRINGTVYIHSANADQILLTSTGAPNGKLLLAYRPNRSDDNNIYVHSSEPLDLDTEYTVKYVYTIDNTKTSGYRCEIYLNGKFVTETDFKYTSDGKNYIVPDLNCYYWPSSSLSTNSQIYIRTFRSSTVDMELDDIKITCIPKAGV